MPPKGKKFFRCIVRERLALVEFEADIPENKASSTKGKGFTLEPKLYIVSGKDGHDGVTLDYEAHLGQHDRLGKRFCD